MPRSLQLVAATRPTCGIIAHRRNRRVARRIPADYQPRISAITPLVPEATREFVPTADDLDPDAQYILDGTLLPCWSWTAARSCTQEAQDHRNDVQVACTIDGKLAWISDPVKGAATTTTAGKNPAYC